MEEKSLSTILRSPFYLFSLVEIFKSRESFATRNDFIRRIIDKNIQEDFKKFASTLNTSITINDLKQWLGCLSICMNYLGISQLSLDDVKSVVGHNWELLKYNGISTVEKGVFRFTHKTYGEFLAAEVLRDFDIPEIEKIVLADKYPEIEVMWLNTLSYLVLDSNSRNFTDWFLKNSVDNIIYLEKANYTEQERYGLFVKLYGLYETKGTWMPTQIIYGEKQFLDFIGTKDILVFLIEKVKGSTGVILGNTLLLIELFEKLFNLEDKLVEQLIEVIKRKKSGTHNIRTALKILANNNLINEETLFGIIEENTGFENSELRAGYFYVINNLELSPKLIDYIISMDEKANYFSSMTKDDDIENIKHYDETREYE